jgi:hypothetical protein
MATHRLEVGDRVVVYGGYDPEPEWLVANPAGYPGRVVEFLPGQNANPAPLIELDDQLVLPAGAGPCEERRFGDCSSSSSSLIEEPTGLRRLLAFTVELCDFRPEPKPWPDRRQGAWVESHATYRVIGAEKGQ